MIVEHIGGRRVLGTSLTVLTIVLSSSVALAQQPAPQPDPPPQQQVEPQQAQPEQAQPQQAQPQQAPQQPSAQLPAQQDSEPRAAEQPSPQQEDVQIARAAPPPAQAQPMMNAVRVIQVKHDRVGEFEGLLKELRTAIQESGLPGFMVWSVAIGDVNTYHVLTQLDSFASIARFEQQPPMEPAEWANWLNRMGDTIDSHTMVIGRMRPELSILPAGQGQQQPPELLMLIRDTVMAGKTREYEAFIRDELVPALRRANVETLVSTELMLGSDGRTWVFAAPLQGWQDLDGPSPLVEALGPQGAEELMLRGDALVDESEIAVLRFRPDLSAQTAP